MSRRLALVFVFCAAVFCPAVAAFADTAPPTPPAACFSPDAQGNLPTSCSDNGNGWSADYTNNPDTPFTQYSKDNGSSVKNFAIGGFVVALALGIVVTVVRVRIARRIATDAGLNPDAATAATLLGTGGLTATYLAANLHSHSDAPDEPPVRHVEPPTHSVESRLAELTALKDKGVITDDEYARRRAAIVDSV